MEVYLLCFDYKDAPGAGFAFPCDKDGKVTRITSSAALDNYNECLNGTHNVGKPYIRDYSRNFTHKEVKECDRCGHAAYLSRSCGVFVCANCHEHEGIVRCFCGWSVNGRWTGRSELVEMGEEVDGEE